MSDDVQEGAVDLVVEFEEDYSFKPDPYRDPTGVPTIGYGSIWDWRTGRPPRGVTMHTPSVDEATARQWVYYELADAARTIAAQVNVPITANQLAALEDFVYNVGSGNFAGSTLLRRLNAGDFEGAAEQFAVWTHAGGRELEGLVRRRAAERELFEKSE